MKIAVLGIGNVLVGDDGFGPYVIETFRSQYEVAPNVDIADVGTPGLDLVPHLAGFDAVIIVDTVKANARPGTLLLYTREQIMAHLPNPRLTPHDPGLKDTLLMMQLTGTCPSDITLIGCVPEAVHTSTEMSESVRAAVPSAVAQIEVALAMLGHPPVKRAEPLVPEIWWEHVVA